ncbi:CLUMA_CG001799, isoform A [Clunio marinus]|uniref:CLUMA_CG001799, isoform A n=1 Tax=Clunio marinus TaxID=568069 RepID=A0A1J1HJ26_9DIPT|nr:CLUMA_CG001799, isoform A [Clunio marinus]
MFLLRFLTLAASQFPTNKPRLDVFVFSCLTAENIDALSDLKCAKMNKRKVTDVDTLATQQRLRQKINLKKLITIMKFSLWSYITARYPQQSTKFSSIIKNLDLDKEFYLSKSLTKV